MDGLLLVDKPLGPTSHDVVHRVRRASGERSIGHTGTLDPRATGLLALTCGRATRLSAFLTGCDKTYEATIQLGLSTTTDDVDGEPIGDAAAELPREADVLDAIDSFRGAFNQTPPVHSAKKIGGERAYALARRAEPVTLAPVAVVVREIRCVGFSAGALALRVSASAGFYVRALARDLGARLGCGAHLASLRRTSLGPFDLSGAVTLDEAERLGRDVASRLLTPAEALPHLAAVRVTDQGRRRVAHGNSVGPEHLGTDVPLPAGPRVRVLGPAGDLLAVADVRGGALHPVVVLG
jgi:tRNA pseudouridine55 synthase